MRLLRSMAALLAAAPFVVASLMAGCTRDRAGSEAPGAVQLDPETHLTLDDGKRLAAERGVPVLVDFWSPT